MTTIYSCSLWTPAATSPACSLTFQAPWQHQELSLVNATEKCSFPIRYGISLKYYPGLHPGEQDSGVDKETITA